MKPFSTYPEDRQKMLALAATIEGKSTLDEDYVKAADELADLVKAILDDEAVTIANEAEFEADLDAADLMKIEEGWQTFKAAGPVAKVINDNQPGRTAIIEILIDPPTLEVGTMLYAAPQPAHGTSATELVPVTMADVIALIKDYGDDAKPDSEYRLACNDLIEALGKPSPAPNAVTAGQGVEGRRPLANAAEKQVAHELRHLREAIENPNKKDWSL